jgi:hypothetical protein
MLDACMPLLCFVLLGLTWLIEVLVLRRRPCLRDYKRTCVVLINLCYMVVFRASVQFLSVRRLPQTDTYFVRNAPYIDPSSDAYVGHAALMWVVFALCILWILYCLVELVRYAT